jgi:glycosyltransferase involved in cell wall biosynthesis
MHLLFVSTRFLFPADSGGKIRTTQILKGLKGGAFRITLASPAPADAAERFGADLRSVCDHFEFWPDGRDSLTGRLRRLGSLFSALPISVASDHSAAGRRAVARCLTRKPDVAVFDFPHSLVLVPEEIEVRSLLFTHNVESWILERHINVAGNAFTRALWIDQHRKMLRFERKALQRFDTVLAVSEKDAAWFVDQLGLENVRTIPTGVDLDYFTWHGPGSGKQIVFIGSMDWLANQDAIAFFLEHVWPTVDRAVPDATMKVIGRSPPDWLVARAPRHKWTFTGYVDDVRPHAQGSAVSVIPLRVGGGTRIKAYEAMAMGLPVVSTSIGVEGLPVVPGSHYLCADDAHGLAASIVQLLQDRELRDRLSRAARLFIETRYSHRTVARAFEAICQETARSRLEPWIRDGVAA